MKGKIILFLFIFNIFFIIANIPFYQRLTLIPDSVSPYIHQGTEDYYLYIAVIRKARDGAWKIPDFYTTETTPLVRYIFLVYIVLGKISRISGLSPAAVYHLTRIIILQINLVLIIYLCRLFAGRKLAFWAAFTGMISTPLYSLWGQQINNPGPLRTIPVAWIYFNPLYRVDMIPHHAISLAALLGTLICFVKKIQRSGNILISGGIFLSFISTVTHPVSGLVVGIALPAAVMTVNLKKYIFKRRVDWPLIFYSLSVAAASAAAILMILKEMNSGFPWIQTRFWDLKYFDSIPGYSRDFILAGGVLLVMVPLAILYVFTKQDYMWVFISIWALLPYLVLPFTGRLGIAKFRLSYIFNFIPLGILCVHAAEMFLRRIRNKSFKVMLAAFIAGWYVWISFSGTKMAYLQTVADYNYVTPITHIPNDIYEAIDYLGKSGDSDSNVFSSDVYGQIIPSFSSMRTYSGYFLYTMGQREKLQIENSFFEGRLNPADVQNIISFNNIRYIFCTVAESGCMNILSYKIPMKLWFKNRSVIIYEVYAN